MTDVTIVTFLPSFCYELSYFRPQTCINVLATLAQALIYVHILKTLSVHILRLKKATDVRDQYKMTI